MRSEKSSVNSIDRGLGHLENKIALFDKDLSTEESGCVISETIVITGLPSDQIEVVEVVPPVQIKISGFLL